jgi:hypothetical protein
MWPERAGKFDEAGSNVGYGSMHDEHGRQRRMSAFPLRIGRLAATELVD